MAWGPSFHGYKEVQDRDSRSSHRSQFQPWVSAQGTRLGNWPDEGQGHTGEVAEQGEQEGLELRAPDQEEVLTGACACLGEPHCTASLGWPCGEERAAMS